MTTSRKVKALAALYLLGSCGGTNATCPETPVPAAHVAQKAHARPPTPTPSAAPHGHSVHADHGKERLGANGHAGSHRRFQDAERWAAVFEDKKRDAWQKGDAVVAALGLANDARIADIGSATGYFTVRLAKKHSKGVVWGIDVEPSMVRYLAKRARQEGLGNLRSVLGEAVDPLLPEPVDLIFICNTYHHIHDRVAYFKRLKSRLRKGGRLAIVDFKMGEIPVGPPPAHRIPPEAIERELKAAGYRLQRRDDKLLPYQHMLIFQG